MKEILALIESATELERQAVFAALRQRIPIHEMEKTLKASAELILEAIGRSSDLTVRGIEGVIAEASFAVEVIPQLTALKEVPVTGDQSFDFLLRDHVGDVRVQVKMQRRKAREPLMASEVQKSRRWPSDYYVVETQRTRSGTRADGEKTRPYRYGSFDVLAVSMGASKGRWSAFMYTVESWLLPAKDPSSIYTFQPVPPSPTEFWTEDFETCVAWLRSGAKKRILG